MMAPECSLFGSVRNKPARQAPNYTSYSPVRKAVYVLPFQDYANVPMRFIQKTQYIICIVTIVFPPLKTHAASIQSCQATIISICSNQLVTHCH